jgi:hypothetical protein
MKSEQKIRKRIDVYLNKVLINSIDNQTSFKVKLINKSLVDWLNNCENKNWNLWRLVIDKKVIDDIDIDYLSKNAKPFLSKLNKELKDLAKFVVLDKSETDDNSLLFIDKQTAKNDKLKFFTKSQFIYLMLLAYFCQIKNTKYNIQIELLDVIRYYNELLFNLSYQFDNSSNRHWILKETHNVVREVMRLVDLKSFYREKYKFNIVDYLKFINSLKFKYGNFYNFDPTDENLFTIEDVKFWRSFRFDDNTVQEVDNAFKQIKDFFNKNTSIIETETKDEQFIKRGRSYCYDKLRSWTKSTNLQFTNNEIALIFLAVFYRKICGRDLGDFSNYDLTNVSELIHCYDFDFYSCSDSSLEKLKDVIQMIVCLPDNIKQAIVNFFDKSTKEILDILEKNDIQLFNINSEKQVRESFDVHDMRDDENEILGERKNDVLDVNKISVDDFYYAPKTTVEHIDDLFKLIKEKIAA